ncbi:MAG: HAD family phosphatase [Opitutales bacterium]
MTKNPIPEMRIGAIFDWDGVVIDSSEHHEKSWEMLAEEVGESLPPDHFKRGFGKRNAVIIPEILNWSQDPAEIERWSLRKEELYREVVAERGLRALDGVRQLLDELNEAKIPCIVGTSTERANVEMSLELLSLHGQFSDMVCSEDVSRGKPDPEVFLKAAEKTGLPPERCFVIEDTAHGLEAALAGGMKAIGVATTRPAEHLAVAHWVATDMTQLNLATIQSLFEDVPIISR